MIELNRKIRYEIIKEIIKNVDQDTIRKLVSYHCSDIDSKMDDVEYRKLELLLYLDEMNECWNERYVDMTDRQFVKIKRQ